MILSPHVVASRSLRRQGAFRLPISCQEARCSSSSSRLRICRGLHIIWWNLSPTLPPSHPRRVLNFSPCVVAADHILLMGFLLLYDFAFRCGASPTIILPGVRSCVPTNDGVIISHPLDYYSMHCRAWVQSTPGHLSNRLSGCARALSQTSSRCFFKKGMRLHSRLLKGMG